jgi:hypothetical protein
VRAEPIGRHLERLCRQRLSAVERAYDEARRDAANALERCSSSNDEEAIRMLEEAHRREAASLEEYMTALRSFRDFLNGRTRPAE